MKSPAMQRKLRLTIAAILSYAWLWVPYTHAGWIVSGYMGGASTHPGCWMTQTEVDPTVKTRMCRV